MDIGIVGGGGGGRRRRLLRSGILLLVVIYIYRRRRSWRVEGLSIGVAVELRVALLFGDALAGGCEAILMSLVMLVRRVLLVPRHHEGLGAGARLQTFSPDWLD